MSLGPEPEATQSKVMNFLVDWDKERAKAELNAMGLKLKITEKEETSDSVKEGCVTRTEPVVGQPLTEGQEVILWISIGPEVKKGYMPNVVGMNYATAKKVLADNGFSNVDFEIVDSNEDKDEVVEQPYPRNEELDLTTEIILKISGGPTEPPTEKPTEATQPPTTLPAEQKVSKVLTVKLPSEGLASEYTLTIRYQGGEERAVDDMKIEPGTSSVKVTLSGVGVQSYDIYINNEYYCTETVEFTANG